MALDAARPRGRRLGATIREHDYDEYVADDDDPGPRLWRAGCLGAEAGDDDDDELWEEGSRAGSRASAESAVASVTRSRGGHHGSAPHVRWRGGPPPHAPQFDGNKKVEKRCYEIWVKKVELWKLRVKHFMPMEEAGIALFEAVNGAAAVDRELDARQHPPCRRSGYDSQSVVRAIP